MDDFFCSVFEEVLDQILLLHTMILLPYHSQAGIKVLIFCFWDERGRDYLSKHLRVRSVDLLKINLSQIAALKKLSQKTIGLLLNQEYKVRFRAILKPLQDF